MAKEVLNNIENVHTSEGVDVAVNNYIHQIDLGEKGLYDIATHHSIKFYNGQQDTTGVAWNGITDLEVVIPTISDLITDPIKFVGTSIPVDAKKGDLVFFTGNGTVDGVAYESGDMAIYDGSKWNVVSGEDQVEILEGTSKGGEQKNVILSATAKSVLFVEGKELTLSIPADLLKNNFGVSKNAETTLNLKEGAKATVNATYITLTYTAANEDTKIGKNSSIDVPTALASGVVTFDGTGVTPLLASDVNNAWTAGTDGEHKKEAVEFAISGNVDLTKVEDSNGDFVTGWTPSTDSFVKNAIKGASLKVLAANEKQEDETVATQPVLVANPTFNNDTTAFATGIATTSSDADFTIPGAVGVKAEGSKADVNGVVTDVTLPQLGDASAFTDANIVDATAETGFLTSIGTPTVTIDNATVMASATVNNHVLSFTTNTVSANYNAGTPTYKKAQYKKTVISNTPSVSYGSIETAAGQGYKLSKQAVNATFNAGEIKYIGVDVTALEASDKASAYIGLNTTKGKYTAAIAPESKGNINAGVVVTSVTDAKVPTLGEINATGTLTGSVSTELNKESKTVGVFDSTWGNGDVKLNIGSYAIANADNETDAGKANSFAIAGKSGDMVVAGSITIAADSFVTDVYANTNLTTTLTKDDTNKVVKL